MRRRVEAIFREVFDLAPATDVRDLEQESTPAWDSLGHVTLVAALENEFNVELSMAESLEITSFAKALLILEERVAEV